MNFTVCDPLEYTMYMESERFKVKCGQYIVSVYNCSNHDPKTNTGDSGDVIKSF